jgi:hypothetical protein
MYGLNEIIFVETGSRDRFFKSLQKMDRSRTREGKQEVSKFFTGSFIKKYIYKFLPANAKLTPTAYV